MTKNLETRPLRPETDAEGLIELFDKVFGHTVSPGMWEWKYRPPWVDRHYCWVGVYDDRIIGYVGAVPLRGGIDGEEVPFFQLADVMVHPDYRLKFDYFSIAVKAILEDLGTTHPRHLLYGFSDHRAFRWFERVGWSGLIEMAMTFRFRPRDSENAGRYAFRGWSWTDPELSRQWESLCGTLQASLIRDGEYVLWRYGRHPVFPYRLMGVHEDGSPLGWVVLGKPSRKTGPVPVVDMLLPEASTGAVLRALSEHEEQPMSAWLPTRLGLDASERKVSNTHVYHFLKNSAVDTSYLKENFYYTMGDVDWW